MQQLNSIILEGKVIAVLDEGYTFKMEHDSVEGRPLSITCHIKRPYNFNYDNFNRSVFRIVGKLCNDDYYGSIIEADFIEEHPNG